MERDDLKKILLPNKPPITNEEYMKFTASTWVQPVNEMLTLDEALNLFCMTTGWAGETGEAIEKIKKFVRDGHLDPLALMKEFGDSLYYFTRLLDFFGMSLDEVIELNVHKLKDREERGVVRGSGDNR